MSNNSASNSSTLVSRWDDFWLKPESPLIPGLLRWLVGGMLVYTHFVWGLQLERFFGPEGAMAADVVQTYQQSQSTWSIWWLISPQMMPIVHLMMLAIVVLFTFGFLTPVTSVLSLVITISNSQRAPIANYGLDQMLSLLMLYLTIAGAGGAFSIDRLIVCWWKRNKSSNTAAGCSNWLIGPDSSRAQLGIRLIQVHYGIIYFFAGLSKLQGETWWNGDAMWLALANREYQSWDMTWLANFPWLTQLLTHASVLWEISFVYLVWYRKIRLWYLLVGVGMHMGIVLFLGMPTFGLIMIFGYLAFIPADWLTNGWQELARSPKVAFGSIWKSICPSWQTATAFAALAAVAMTVGLLRPQTVSPTDLQVDQLASRAYLLEEQGDFEGAITALTQALKLTPDDPLLHYDCGVYYEQLQQWQPALESYTRTLELDASMQRAYNNRGLIRLRQQQYDDALTDFNRAIELNPQDALPFRNRGELRLEQQQFQAAYDDFSQAIARSSDDAIQYVYRGEAALELDNWVAAIEDLGRAKLLAANLPEVIDFAAQCQQYLEDKKFLAGQAVDAGDPQPIPIPVPEVVPIPLPKVD